VRAMNAYGPRQSVAPPFGPAKVRKIMPSLVCRALTGNSMELYGGGEQVSDMVHVRDVAQALVRSLEHSAKRIVYGHPVEVGPPSDKSMSIRSVANTVQRITAEMYDTPVVPHRDLPMRPGEIVGARVSADVSTLEYCGMDPYSLTDFAAGARETIEWYHDNWLPKWNAEAQQVLQATRKITDSPQA